MKGNLITNILYLIFFSDYRPTSTKQKLCMVEDQRSSDYEVTLSE